MVERTTEICCLQCISKCNNKLCWQIYYCTYWKTTATIKIFLVIIGHLHNNFTFIKLFRNKPLFDFPSWDKSFYFSLLQPDRLRCPNIFLFDGHRGLLVGSHIMGREPDRLPRSIVKVNGDISTRAFKAYTQTRLLLVMSSNNLLANLC